MSWLDEIPVDPDLQAPRPFDPCWQWTNEPLTANDPRTAAELVAEYEYLRYDPGYVGKVQRRPDDENPKPSRIYTDADGTVHIVND